MSDSNANGGGGFGFAGMLTLLFIGLKLCSVIEWSWWWVLSPLWLPIALLAAVLVPLAAFNWCCDKWLSKR